MVQKTPPPQSTAQPTTPARHFSVQLSPTRRGARLARLLAAEQLRDWGLPLDPARIVIAELANNAVQHGRVPGRDFLLVVRDLGGVLRIEVSDTRGDRMPRPQLASPDAESGYGLALVQACTTAWGVTEGPSPRKTVWAEIAVG
ncbi:ATP-binding protein [Streptomyces roseirectus]|uniref:ATP-binding protein n=1 Tax=Streptomyces roseirectus TaxID=2768066 RepID=UPI001FE6FC04|nr:ATP-binding protein [Streptomyces roseirectus]